MKTLSLSSLALAIMATVAVAVLAGSDNDAATLNQISGYRQWTRVNPDPVKVDVPVNTTAGGISINPAALT